MKYISNRKKPVWYRSNNGTRKSIFETF